MNIYIFIKWAWLGPKFFSSLPLVWQEYPGQRSIESKWQGCNTREIEQNSGNSGVDSLFLKQGIGQTLLSTYFAFNFFVTSVLPYHFDSKQV